MDDILSYLNNIKELAAKKFEGSWTLEKIGEALRVRAAHYV